MSTSGVAHRDGYPGRALFGIRHRWRPSASMLGTPRFRAALCLLGVVASSLIALPTIRSGGVDALDTTVVLQVLVGWSFVASGFVAWDRRPANPIGALLLLLGFWWIAGRLMGPPTTSSPLVNSIGTVWRLAWVSWFVFVLLSFPRGRLSTAPERLLAGVVFVAAVPLEVIWLLFLETEDPRNAFLVWPSAATASAVDTAQRILWLGAALALVAMLAVRWHRAGRPARRTLVPVVAGGLTVLVFSALVIVQQFRTVPIYLIWAVFAAYTAVPLALLASILRARLARSSVGDLFIELRANPAPDRLRDALAHALGDPSLELAFWLPDYEAYADLEGRPTELPDDAGRATTLVDCDGAHLAAIVHDASLREEPALLDAVCAAAGIAIENAQLQAELRARLAELKGSRARILKATQAERERLERNLHDGAQQRLVSLSLELRVVGASLEPDTAAKRALDRARTELAESLQELRDLARGIHPAVVTSHGLKVALQGVAARAPIPVRMRVDLSSRLPEPVEVAAYYLVSESLTNVARHARASGAEVEVTRTDHDLVVEVVDDGVGGATTEGGSGLRGLADRVEALGGRVRVWSPAGGGTRIRAEIPCG